MIDICKTCQTPIGFREINELDGFCHRCFQLMLLKSETTTPTIDAENTIENITDAVDWITSAHTPMEIRTRLDDWETAFGKTGGWFCEIFDDCPTMGDCLARALREESYYKCGLCDYIEPIIIDFAKTWKKEDENEVLNDEFNTDFDLHDDYDHEVFEEIYCKVCPFRNKNSCKLGLVRSMRIQCMALCNKYNGATLMEVLTKLNQEQKLHDGIGQKHLILYLMEKMYSGKSKINSKELATNKIVTPQPTLPVFSFYEVL
jgi:hypothetical protein